MRMYQFIGPVLLAITLAEAASAQAPSAVTNGMLNGRFWSKQTQDEKIAWILGYLEGIKSAAVFVSGAEPDNKLLQQAIMDLRPTNKLTLEEIVQGMDHFYRDIPENAPVPMVGALQYVGTKAKGAKQSELDDLASGMRKAASSTPEKKP
jgi:hypothetical protein